MGHKVWRLLKGFLLFKAYIGMSVSCVKLTVAMLELKLELCLASKC